MALYSNNGVLLANVALTDTFNVQRIRINQIMSLAAGLNANNIFTGSNNTFANNVTFANTVTFSNTVNFGGGSISLNSSNTVIGGNVTMNNTLLVGNKTVGGIMTINHLVANTITANGATPTGAGQVIISNSIGGMYWSTADFGTDTTVTTDNSTNATRYPLFTATTSGDVTGTNVSTSKLTFNPSSGTLTATSLGGELVTPTQLNVTRLGTQVALTVSAPATIDGSTIAGSTSNTIFTGNVTIRGANGISLGGNTQIYLDQENGSNNSIVFRTGNIAREVMRITHGGGLSVGSAVDPGNGAIHATDDITAFYSSDLKFKENIRDVDEAVEKVSAIGVKYFDWTDEYIKSKGGEHDYFLPKKSFGVIAQDVQKVFPEAVRTRQNGSLAVDYEKLAILSFGAIKELVKRIEKLEQKD